MTKITNYWIKIAKNSTKMINYLKIIHVNQRADLALNI